MALTVVKLKKAQNQDASMARNYGSVYDISGTSSQNQIIRVTKSSVPTKMKPQINAHVQPFKRSRPIVIDDTQIVMTNKKFTSTNRQPIPIHSIQKISSGGGNIINTQQKFISINNKNVGGSGVKLEPNVAFKISGNNIITTGGNNINKQYAYVSSNGIINTSVSSKIIGHSVIHQQQQQQHQHYQQQQRQQQQHQHQLEQQQHQQHLQQQYHQQQQQMKRPTIYIKGSPKKSLRTLTVELIEKSPQLHLGVNTEHLSILKSTVCPIADILIVDLYMTLKKLRHNEDFNLLSEYFEYPKSSSASSFSTTTAISTVVTEDDCNNIEIINVFIRTICKLAKYLRYLIRWPEGKKYYDRHKNLPIQFRTKLSFVQSLVECVEIEIQPSLLNTTFMYSNELSKTKTKTKKSITSATNDNNSNNNNSNNDQIISVQFPSKLSSYKFILTMTPNGIITYISDVCAGYCDDITVFNVCKYYDVIPKYLSLVADPGIAFRHKTKLKCLLNKTNHQQAKINENKIKYQTNENLNTNINNKINNNNNNKNNKNNNSNSNGNNNNNNNDGNKDDNDNDNNKNSNKNNNKKNNDKNTQKLQKENNNDDDDDNNIKNSKNIKNKNDGNDNTNINIITNTVDIEDYNEEYGNDNYDNNVNNIIEDEINERRQIIKLPLSSSPTSSSSPITSFTKLSIEDNTKNYISSSNRSMEIINNELISKNVKKLKIPTIHVNDNNICRTQITQTLTSMKEFKILQPYSIIEPQLYSYLNEILIVISAILNLQR